MVMRTLTMACPKAHQDKKSSVKKTSATKNHIKKRSVKKSSRLLALLTELRNEIYRLVLNEDRDIAVRFESTPNQESSSPTVLIAPD